MLEGVVGASPFLIKRRMSAGSGPALVPPSVAETLWMARVPEAAREGPSLARTRSDPCPSKMYPGAKVESASAWDRPNRWIHHSLFPEEECPLTGPQTEEGFSEGPSVVKIQSMGPLPPQWEAPGPKKWESERNISPTDVKQPSVVPLGSRHGNIVGGHMDVSPPSKTSLAFLMDSEPAVHSDRTLGDGANQEFVTRSSIDGFSVCCSICNRTFSRPADRKRHVKTVHMNMRDHECKICPRTFKQKSHLDSHVDAVHFSRKPHVCNICDQRFTRNTTLRKHLESKHG